MTPIPKRLLVRSTSEVNFVPNLIERGIHFIWMGLGWLRGWRANDWWILLMNMKWWSTKWWYVCGISYKLQQIAIRINWFPTVSSLHPIALSPALAWDLKVHRSWIFRSCVLLNQKYWVNSIDPLNCNKVQITFIEEGWDGQDSKIASPHPFGPNLALQDSKLYQSFKQYHTYLAF